MCGKNDYTAKLKVFRVKVLSVAIRIKKDCIKVEMCVHLLFYKKLTIDIQAQLS